MSYIKTLRDYALATFCKSVLVGVCTLFLIGPIAAQQALDLKKNTPDVVLVSAGEKLFKGNCTVCHQINEKLIGPALRDVHKRRSVTWIKSFVRNSQKVIESGDPYAVALYGKYNQTQMTAFDFEDEELDAIVAYISSESSKPIPTQEVANASASGEASSADSAGVTSGELHVLWGIVFLLLLLILLVVSVFLVFLKNYALQKIDLSAEDKELLAPEKNPIKKRVKVNTILGVVVFFFVLIAVQKTLEGLYGIGIQQGYTPKQPIAFSHKIHAGQHEIDCNYCHTGVRKSKSANIPSVNICMNCHGEIKKESPEIQKLYTALDKKRPIEWVRVHNLPDLSYFNHAQHVKVGKVACETCHGDVKNMEIIQQYAPLTMGWCINCHKETQINSKDNVYYEKLIKIHNSNKPLRVKDIGGLECSKCHY